MKNLVSNLKTIFFGLFLYTLCFILYTPIYAVSMDSSRFKIDLTNVGVAGDKVSSNGYSLSDTVGQLAAGQYSSKGYVVKAGFQYLQTVAPFRFSVSNTNINLGALVPGTPLTATTNLIISFGDGQYQVTAIEEGPLKTQSGKVIPDTTCDGGDNTCSESLARVWSSSTAYGFGYGMSGNDIADDFIDGTYYRPFPDQTSSESPATVMISNTTKSNRQSTMTFKTNVSSTQPVGSYQTVINFVATPSY